MTTPADAPDDAAAIPASALGKPLVLVVDDQLANVQAVGSLLARSDLDVMPALSGEQALARLAQRAPDLILLDMMMPGMDGFEVCRRLRGDARHAAIPIIFLTAANERHLLVRAFAAGAVDYVTKPFVAEELLARVRTHIDLKRSRDHLARIARECNDLTQIVAHDLKSPLSSIRFSALMLLQRLASDDRLRSLAESIRESTDDALRFVHDYLEQWAEGELKRRFERVPLDLSVLVRRVAERMQPAATSRGLVIAINALPSDPVFADWTAVSHVIENLISNAIKYGPADDRIDIEIGPGAPGMVRVAVCDRGPGLSEQAQKQLFQRYVRLGKRAAEDSSGLGLAIAKQDISQLGGHLWFESREGGGAVFAFDLPVAAVE
ncbi:MAG: hybrid sensor histidine kinase/response regulator [Xanthomonadales bacterium]|nr:hybrid sensor histidine kinase/response regulator [Xanthomonadales bacterium]MBP7622533.1 hybrid sensor histidine kinase/response regulator [Xanthomonadales bacterium]